MIFQWYLFVILFGVYLFSRASHQYYTVRIAGEEEIRYRWFPVLLITAVLTYVAATRSNFGDTNAYISGFRKTTASLSAIPAALAAGGKDKGFSVFTILVKCLVGDRHQIYFGIIAGFCMCCVSYVYQKHSCNYMMTMFLLLASGEYAQWTHNGMRQFIAVAMIFAATDLLLNKKYVPYYAIVLFASTFHASALIMIPMSMIVQGKPWNSRTVLFVVAVLVAVTSVDTLTELITNLMESTQYAGEVDQFLKTTGTNVFRVLVFCIPPMMSLVFLRYLPGTDPFLNLSINMSIASMGTYIVSMFTSGIFIGRIPIYFSLYNYALLPAIIERTFEKRSANLVYLMVMGCYAVYYYYQMHVVWGV